MKAIAIRPEVIRTIGEPWKLYGMSLSSILSTNACQQYDCDSETNRSTESVCYTENEVVTLLYVGQGRTQNCTVGRNQRKEYTSAEYRLACSSLRTSQRTVPVLQLPE